MINCNKKRYLNNAINLFDTTEENYELSEIIEEKSREILASDEISLNKFLRQADSKLKSIHFAFASAISGILVTFLSSYLLSSYLLPITFLFGCSIPYLHLESKIRKRASVFSADYPSVLLATASSIKVGLTPYQALEKSVELLEESSLIRIEIKALLRSIHQEQNRNQAIERFAINIRLPELELFRSALKLVLENGGRFSPTLTRLAAVSSNRSSLIRTAEVTTATMRMTANILLLIAPFLLLMLSLKTQNYWNTLLHNQTANLIASIGSIIIICCYLILNRLSHFKP
ncbi:MAG: hypothetical protein KBC84_05345 [Proteobacteria bacterium]|nr:hypothetical protein [Pseudomonadota bacterium]